MSQNRYAIPAWSYLFEQLPPRRIIEIGTSVGGMTCLLAVACRAYGSDLYTFDISPTMSAETELTLHAFAGKLLSVITGDVLDSDISAIIETIISRPGPSLVLCDGGNKVKEFRTFSQALKPGDVIAAHDFGATEAWPWEEIKIGQVADVVQAHGLSRFMEDVFEKTGWLVCRKKPF
jgi:predicted O-methyltransferase YrrM